MIKNKERKVKMVFSPIEQIKESINKAGQILVCLPKNPTTDAIASSLALFSVLEKMDNKAKVVCNEFVLPPNHQFLPKSKDILTDLTSLRKFIISVNVQNAKVEELSYDIQDENLNIFITPKTGTIREKDVRFSSSEFEYDLIIVLDSPDLESLGALYDDNTEFFYDTPIINIDHSPQNEYFGQIDLVELTATSTSEIVFDLVKAFGEEMLDEYIATSLLAGIISKTKSFQSASVTPKSLAIASHLISSGARREEIVQHLYQTKSLATLRLWGRALARLKSDQELGLVWSLLTHEDFEKAGLKGDSNIPGVIDELIINAPEAKVVMVLYESGKEVHGIVNTPKTMDAMEMLANFSPEGTKDFTKITILRKSLPEAEKEVLESVKPYLIKEAEKSTA